MNQPARAPEAVYAARAEEFRGESVRLTQRFNRTANLRLVLFVAAAAPLIWSAAQQSLLAAGIGLVLVVGFASLVRYHRALALRRDRAAALCAINLEARARCERDWDALPLRHAIPTDRLHPYAADLDLFGHASLLHVLDTTATPLGQATLGDWLLHAAPPATVGERQVGAAELANQLDARQALEACGRTTHDARPDPEPFLAWAESNPTLVHRPVRLWAARLSPALLCVLAVAHAIGWLAVPLWLPFLVANFVLWHAFGKHAYATLARIDEHQQALGVYAASIGVLSGAAFDAALLKRLLATLTADGRSADVHLRHVERMTQLVVPRSAMVYWILQPVLLWDVHVLAALESWQARVGRFARMWLTALGEVEALAALATLAHAHPEWAWPDLDESARCLEARLAGHPLLAPSRRVDNDVQLGPPATFLLVTGSNMAGKSTLLRTIGSNIVLAQAGGPVCATAFRLPPLELWTSMRVVDSLERGVSTFLAEVLRLKQVVDAARERTVNDPLLCYLLDELLQGTNTAERQIAARRVIRFQLSRPTIGAVSTHDLTLAEAPELVAAAQLVHFRETLNNSGDGPAMTFDYALQPGLATSTNALRLLEMVGLDAD